MLKTSCVTPPASHLIASVTSLPKDLGSLVVSCRLFLRRCPLSFRGAFLLDTHYVSSLSICFTVLSHTPWFTPRSRPRSNLVPTGGDPAEEFRAVATAAGRGSAPGSAAGSKVAAVRVVSGPRRPAGAITIRTLLEAGLLAAGEGVLSIEYKGSVTWGHLNGAGQLMFEGASDLDLDPPVQFPDQRDVGAPQRGRTAHV